MKSLKKKLSSNETVGEMIRDLDRTGSVDDSDPFDLQNRLNAALPAIVPKQGAMSRTQHLANSMISHSIYLAHLIVCRSYSLDQALGAISNLSKGLSAIAEHLAHGRPREKMYGIRVGTSILPFAFNTEGEAEAYITVLRKASPDSIINTVRVEVTTDELNIGLRRPEQLEVPRTSMPSTRGSNGKLEDEEEIIDLVHKISEAAEPKHQEVPVK